MAQAPGQSCQSAESAKSAELFAPNLADPGALFRGTFSPDGRTLYYFRKVTAGTEDYRIYTSRKTPNGWSAPVRLDLGGEVSDLYPSLSPDGKRLVFVSYRPAPSDTSREPNGYLWYSDRTGDGWGPPIFIGAASQLGTYHSGPVIARDYSIHFHRTSADWRTKWSLETRWNGKAYEPAQPAVDEALIDRWKGWQNGKYHIWGATLPRPDLLLIEMSEKNAAGRPQPPELWISRQQGTEWSEPVLAGGGVNTPAPENFFSLTPDGCGLLFVRDFSQFYIVSIAAM